MSLQTFQANVRLEDDSRVPEALAALNARKHPRYGFLDSAQAADEQNTVTRLAREIRSRTDHLLVLGIGGSSLGAIAVMNACLLPDRDRVTVLESPDPVSLTRIMAKLDPKRTAVNVISKSGNTIETLSQWAVLKQWLGADHKDRVVITTDPEKGPLRKMAVTEGYRTLPVPEMIGGRFSVFTPVGTFPLVYAGADIGRFAAGIRVASTRLTNDGFAARIAKTLVQAHLIERRNLVVLWPYGDALTQMGRWFQQLWGESLGKAQHTDGTVAHTGSTPLACVGPNDQHSMLQLFADGPRDKHFLFLSVAEMPERLMVEATPVAGLDYLQGLELGQILRAEALATSAALASNKHPTTFVSLPSLSQEMIAELMTHLMAATVIASRMYDVDPFDQPAVETGKIIALGLLGHPDHKNALEQFRPFLPTF